MRILFVDIDSLRPDHLGCYGYHRGTSPAIDCVAAQGVRFNNCYTPDAPCLPSRTALITGRFGIKTGVVNHGGTAADPVCIGPERQFLSVPQRYTLFEAMDRAGLHVASISPFPNRHAAWHFLAGVREYHNPGRSMGNESAHEVNAAVIPWIERHARNDNWFLHVNYWDPHRPYRVPEEFGNPFAADPAPAWMTEEIRQRHWNGCGLQSAQDPNDGTDHTDHPRMPATISSMAEYRRWIDGYDVGIRYADHHLGKVIEALKAAGVWEETAVVITADHGENQGELNYYGAHRTGDHVTHHIPLIVRWPGRAAAGRADDRLCYSFDISATLLDLLGIERPSTWDARPLTQAIDGHADPGREFLVLSQLACMVQRSVRFDRWLMMRTWHDGFSGFPEIMLFDIASDPHELRDLSAEQPEVVGRGLQLLDRWRTDILAAQPPHAAHDPLEIVLREHPYHSRPAELLRYAARLRATGRGKLADALEARPRPVGRL